jgi:hypothetical protein
MSDVSNHAPAPFALPDDLPAASAGRTAAPSLRAERTNPRKRHDASRPVTEMPDDTEDDRLRIPRDQFPDQMDLCWVTSSILGQPQPNNLSRRARRGWEPVHGDDFEGLYDGRFTAPDHKGPIEIDGLMLCARTLSWSKQAKAEELARAQGAVQIKAQALANGSALQEVSRPSPLADSRHPSARSMSGVRRHMGETPIPVPSEDHGR